MDGKTGGGDKRARRYSAGDATQREFERRSLENSDESLELTAQIGEGGICVFN